MKRPAPLEYEELLRPGEVARMFRVDTVAVARWARTGKLTTIRTPAGHRRFRKSEVDALLTDWQKS